MTAPHPMRLWVICRVNDEPDVDGNAVTPIRAFVDEAAAMVALGRYRLTGAEFDIRTVELAQHGAAPDTLPAYG